MGSHGVHSLKRKKDQFTHLQNTSSSLSRKFLLLGRSKPQSILISQVDVYMELNKHVMIQNIVIDVDAKDAYQMSFIALHTHTFDTLLTVHAPKTCDNGSHDTAGILGCVQQMHLFI